MGRKLPKESPLYLIDKDTLDQIIDITTKISSGKAPVEALAAITKEVRPRKLTELAESLGMMAVQIQSRQMMFERLFFSIVEALSEAIDAKSPWTAGHSKRVTEYALAMARLINLPETAMRDLRIAAMLHDIGKIGIPERILNKRAALSRKEMLVMEQHPLIGEKIMAHIGDLSDIITVIKHHHERFDGTGYPDRLKATEIPLLSRIVAVADAYESMTTQNRPYRVRISPAEAIEVLQKEKDKQWEGYIVDLMIQVINEGEENGYDVTAAA